MGIQNSFGVTKDHVLTDEMFCDMLNGIFANNFGLNSHQKTELHTQNSKLKFERETCKRNTKMTMKGNRNY